MLAAPEQIGRYQIVGTLGKGGMGVVYLGLDEQGRRVAIKTVAVPGEMRLAGIRREIIALSRVRHPSIAGVLDHGVADGIPWYAMELVEGQTLRSWSAKTASQTGTNRGSFDDVR